MAKRPSGVDRATWQSQRASVWKRRNWILNALMLVAIVAVLLRYCAFG